MRKVRTVLLLTLHVPFVVVGMVYQVMRAGFIIGGRMSAEYMARWI